jgi:hypothetical protein
VICWSQAGTELESKLDTSGTKLDTVFAEMQQ